MELLKCASSVKGDLLSGEESEVLESVFSEAMECQLRRFSGVGGTLSERYLLPWRLTIWSSLKVIVEKSGLSTGMNWVQECNKKLYNSGNNTGLSVHDRGSSIKTECSRDRCYVQKGTNKEYRECVKSMFLHWKHEIIIKEAKTKEIVQTDTKT